MSVTQVKNFMEKSGCATIVAISMALVFALGIIGTSCSRSSSGTEDQAAESDLLTVATVGSAKVSETQIEAIYQASQQQFQQMMSQAGDFETTTPAQEAQGLASAIYQAVEQGVLLEVAAKNGVKMTDEEAKKFLRQEVSKQVTQMREMLVQQGKLKPTSTDQEFSDAFKAQAGQTPEQAIDGQMQQVSTMLADPTQRASVMASLTRQALLTKLGANVTVSDDDLKKSRNVLTVQRIWVPTLTDEAKAKEHIEKALAEVKAGKPFGDVVQAYSKDLPEPKKTLKESQQSLPMQTVLSTPGLEGLKTLAAGQTSQVIKLDGGYAIYKVIKLQSNPIADFEKEKAALRDQVVQPLASARLDAEMKSTRETSKVTWKSKGYEALYRVAEAQREATTPESVAPVYREVYSMAKDALTSDDLGRRASAFAMYLVSGTLQGTAKPEEKEQAREDRIEALKAVLEVTDSPQVRIELATLLTEKKDSEAIEHVLAAAQSNNFYGQMGQSFNDDVTAALAKLESAKLLQPGDKEKIESEQQRWIKERKQYEKDKAEQKRIEEEERKRAEAEAKKAEEEAKKEQAANLEPKKRENPAPALPAPPAGK